MMNAQRLAVLLLLCCAPLVASAQQVPEAGAAGQQEPVPPKAPDEADEGCVRNAEGELQCSIGVVITVIKKD